MDQESFVILRGHVTTLKIKHVCEHWGSYTHPSDTTNTVLMAYVTAGLGQPCPDCFHGYYAHQKKVLAYLETRIAKLDEDRMTVPYTESLGISRALKELQRIQLLVQE